MKINLTTVSKCQLNCRFCMQSQGLEYTEQTFTFDRFKEVVDKAIDIGFDEFDLTPNMGDIFDAHDVYYRLKYLNTTKKVKKYSFATHLLGTGPECMRHILDSDKIWVDISIYGWNREVYINQTGEDRFDDFLENFKDFVCLANLHPHSKPMRNINLYMRSGVTFDDFPESETRRWLEEAISLGAMVENDEVGDLNWGGKINQGKSNPPKKGVCVHLIIHNGVYPDGDMTMCCCWDTNKELVFANIDEGDIFNDRYWQYITSHLSGNYRGICENCNDFYAASPEDLDEYPHLKNLKRLIK